MLLNCNENPIQILDLSNCINLHYLYAEYTDLVFVDLRGIGIGACDDCKTANVIIDDTPIANGTFLKISRNIQSSGTIAAGDQVIFHADFTINLSSGFSAEPGGKFIGSVLPCNQ